jgi:hypothetical protein
MGCRRLNMLIYVHNCGIFEEIGRLFLEGVG